MRKLLVYLKDYRKECILGPIFKLVEVIFELMVPLIMASLIDDGIATENMSYIAKMFGVLVLFGICGLISAVSAQYFSAKAAVGFAKKVKNALFAHIQQLSFQELDQVGSSTLITRMTSDMNQVQTGVNMTLRLLLRSPFVVFGAMIMAFTIDVKAALVFVVTIPLLSVVVFGIMLFCIPWYRKVQEQLDKVLGLTRENLTGTRVVRAFCKEEDEIVEFRNGTEALTIIQKTVGRVSALMNPVTYIIINGAIAYLIYTGAVRVSVGELTQGQVIALYNYMSQILVELIKLANLIISMTKTIACGNRIQAIFEINAKMVEGQAVVSEEKSDYMVEFQNVSLKYNDEGEPALSDVTFSVKPGQTVGVIGGTGAGKSSLVHLLCRFYDVTDGVVKINGRDIKEYSYESLRSKVSICLQKAIVFQGSIRENLLWGKENATEEEMLQAIEIAQATEIVKGKEDGLDHRISQGGKNLSGGQKQRLTIARALMQDSDILILDDSSSALDYATDAALRKSLAAMDKKATIFLVSQRTASIQHADLILVLEDGKLVGADTHERLLKDCQVYQEIYYSQYKKEEKKHA